MIISLGPVSFLAKIQPIHKKYIVCETIAQIDQSTKISCDEYCFENIRIGVTGSALLT